VQTSSSRVPAPTLRTSIAEDGLAHTGQARPNGRLQPLLASLVLTVILSPSHWAARPGRPAVPARRLQRRRRARHRGSEIHAFLSISRRGAPSCDDAADANDDGELDLSDALYTLAERFVGDPAHPEPTSVCGPDPTDDNLECVAYAPCGSPRGVLEVWLDAHPEVSDALVWWERDRGWVAHAEWSAELEGRLLGDFETLWSGTAAPVNPLPENHVSLQDVQVPWVVLSESDATTLYISLVAQSLLVELQGVVPWSLTDYEATELRTLLDGRDLFPSVVCLPDVGPVAPPPPAPDCDVEFRLGTSRSLPAPGADAYVFLRDTVGVASSRVDTIANLIEWSRGNMLHYQGSYRTDVVQYYWGYQGAVAGASVIAGRDPDGLHPQSGVEAGFSHWTAGCHGTNTFYREVLRVINVPVRYEVWDGHAIPHFQSESLYMSHGDDPYSALSSADFPASLLLIDAETHRSWFVDSPTPLNNVGRQPIALSAIYFPPYLVRERCDDLAAGFGNAEGGVFGLLQRAYTFEELDELSFWENIDAKIAADGGCPNGAR